MTSSMLGLTWLTSRGLCARGESVEGFTGFCGIDSGFGFGDAAVGEVAVGRGDVGLFCGTAVAE